VAGRVYLKAREILALGYGMAWAHTVNGLSTNNTLQFFRGVARLRSTARWRGRGLLLVQPQNHVPRVLRAAQDPGEWRAFVNAAFAFR